MTNLIIGLVIGLSVGLLVAWWRVRDIRSMHSAMIEEKRRENEQLISQLKESFGALSLEALSKNTEEFLKTANEKFSQQFSQNNETSNKEMASKKELIDQTLKEMKGELSKVNTLVKDIETDRKAKFEVLSSEITKAAHETKSLRETTHSLKSALTNSRVRGQWGERMAEDVLRLAGFVKGVNYLKQVITDDNSRPDYTFYLPDNHIVHMDVKFPLENYLNYTNAENETEKNAFKEQFMRDAKQRIDEVTKRNYIDTSNGTLDYVLVFIPNEQVYAFIHEQDRDLLDRTLKKKIILCSPTTLYAVLAVIRQAVDNFHMERKASEILDVLASFQKQWEAFTQAVEKVGRGIDSSAKAYEELTGVRKRGIERQLDKIKDLRKDEKALPAPELKLVENK